jgi:hypothetical protein
VTAILLASNDNPEGQCAGPSYFVCYKVFSEAVGPAVIESRRCLGSAKLLLKSRAPSAGVELRAYKRVLMAMFSVAAPEAPMPKTMKAAVEHTIDGPGAIEYRSRVQDTG